MSNDDEQAPTWGVVTLSAANYQSFEDEVDKLAAERGIDRVELREALAAWVDHDLETVVQEYDVPRSIIREGATRCTRAAEQQYPELV